jgi:uncharacterized membrane protein YfcA
MDDYHTGIAFLISLGTLVGFINGLLGIAGTATFVSALLIGLPHFFGISGPDVAKIALASAVGLILPIAIATTQTNASRGTVDWWHLAWFTPSVLAGAFVASLFVFALSAKLMMIVLAVAVLITAWQMLAGKQERLLETLTQQRPERWALTWRGVLGGAACSLLALGTSFFAVPLLSRHLLMERAFGTAMALAIPLSVAGVTGYLLANPPGECQGMCTGYVFLPAVAAAGIGAVLAAPVGTALGRHLPVRPLRRLWGLWLLVVAGHIFSSAFDPAQMGRALQSGMAETRHLMRRAEVALWPDAARPAAPVLPEWMTAGHAPYFTLASIYGPQRAFLPLMVARDETGVQTVRAFFVRIERDRPDWFAAADIEEEIAAVLARSAPVPLPERRPPQRRPAAVAAAADSKRPSVRQRTVGRSPTTQNTIPTAATTTESSLSSFFFDQ